MNNEENEGGFVSHLTELRKRLIHSFLFLFAFFIGCYFFAENIYGFLIDVFRCPYGNFKFSGNLDIRQHL